MSSSPSSPRAFDVQEPISGYFTRELIGRGGFGEVWKAEAPGGLEKAIKIVHAGIDPTRAERELRSLQRVKDVRHPLTLSIERIEIVEGSLVIVTELADCSLKDVFRKCRTKGQPGIPRDNLLTFLRDAADALDYIYEEHSLQHLDIKPENLLVVGNRLKLGDFGLLKNIYERGASLVSGLTPTYAPPELFEGRPTRQSDQYSLAIVYQQMLTGELPFEGATSAQLAREHLSGVPRLGPLSRSERPILARALSKVPGERYESCAALISALAAAPPDDPEDVDDEAEELAETQQTQTVSVAVPAPQSGVLGAAREALGDDGGCSQPDSDGAAPDALLSAIELSLQPTRHSSDSSSRRSGAIPAAGFVPTVFLGVGGTGGLVLQGLRRRIKDACGSLKAVPAIQMVLMDTDGKQINSLMQGQDGWEELDAVALPLRLPQDYRYRESGLNKWLHRRWLYNMSRSQQTEGYRPLGRLALVDHGSRALVSIRSALTAAASADSVAQTADTTGLPFRQGHTRVIVVASISGGTGSGILLDLAYAVRAELKRRGCSDEDVLGFLLHSTPSAPADRDKALGNAYATLSELAHYCRPGHFYPGEDAVKAPSFHGDNCTFSAAYLVPLGDNLDDTGWRAGAARVAEYLYCTTITPARMVVDAARHADENPASSDSSGVMLRSLDVCRLDHSDSGEMVEFIEQACRDVVAMWQSGCDAMWSRPVRAADSAALIEIDSKPVERNDVPQADAPRQRLIDCGLERNRLEQLAREIVEQHWECPEPDYLRRLFEQLCREGKERTVALDQLPNAAARLMDRLLGDAAHPVESATDAVLICDKLRETLAARAAELGARLVDDVGRILDDPAGGVKAARSAAHRMTEHIKDLSRALERQISQCGAKPAPAPAVEPASEHRSWRGIFRKRVDPRPALLDQLVNWGVTRLDHAKRPCLRQFLNLIEAQISLVTDQLNHLSLELKGLSAEFQSSAPPDNDNTASAPGPAAREYANRIRSALRHDREQIARTVNDDLLRAVLDGEKKLQRFLGARSQMRSTLVTPLRNLARQVVLSHVRQTTQALIHESAGQSSRGEESNCARLVAEFVHDRRLTPEAGRERMVVLAPETVDPKCLQAAFSSCRAATLISARTNGITLCCEGAARSLESIAEEIIGEQDLYRQLGAKLHTREDVNWSPLALPPDRKSGSVPDAVPAS